MIRSNHKEQKFGEVLLLSLQDILRCQGDSIELAYNDVRKGLDLNHQGKVFLPHKLSVNPWGGEQEHHKGMINILPSHVEGKERSYFSFKLIGSSPTNKGRYQLPRATGLITLQDSETKVPFAILDAQVISAIRTAAVTALACELLADQELESVALLGAGLNMKTQLIALKHRLPHLQTVYVWSKSDSNQLFKKKMEERTGLTIIPLSQVEETVFQQKLILSCLGSLPEPILKADFVTKKGVTLFNIGGLEMDPHLLPTMDKIVADSWSHGFHRANQTHAVACRCQIIDYDKVIELQDIFTGQQDGRNTPDERIFFCPTGLGYLDALIAYRIYQRACTEKIGQVWSSWKDTDWI